MAFALVANTGVGGSISGATTAGINTTGADFLVVAVACYSAGPATLSDLVGGNSNTWTPLTLRDDGVDTTQFYYCKPAFVGSGHTFTVAGASSFSGLCVQAWSGAAAASPADQQNGATTGGATSLATGSITPSQANCLVVASLCTNLNTDFSTAGAINGGFTISNRLDSSPGVGFAHGMAYLVQTSAVAANPTWSWTSSNAAAAAIASFKDVGGGGATRPVKMAGDWGGFAGAGGGFAA